MVLTGEILENGIANKMPEGLSFTHAAVSELCNSVLATHEKAGTLAGDTVVVIGAFSYHPRFHKLALDLLADGKLPAGLLITHTFELGEINQDGDMVRHTGDPYV